MKVNKARQVKHCRETLQAAQADGDKRQIALALADLGYALFQVRKFEEGLEAFEGATEQAAALGDLTLRKQCLGRQALAYQSAGRLPDAYQVATQIFELGERHDDMAVQCDGRLSQGQILLESGEPLIALERLQAALQLARSLSDRRREMNALGSLGHLSLNMATTDQAEAYFRKALVIARELEDAEAEHGYLGNVAMVLSFHRKHNEAIDAFKTVLAYFEKENNRNAAVEALRHLVQAYKALNDAENVVEYARKGIELVEAERPDDLFFFYENLIIALYQLERRAEAERITEEAITAAGASRDHQRGVTFNLSLGESYLLSGMPDKAIAAYKDALADASRLSRRQDEAYLTGRIGLALAEADRAEEAIEWHERAIQLARRREILELEAEQLSMLAMAHLDLARQDANQNLTQHLEQARQMAQTSLEIYTAADLKDRAAHAHQLLADIKALAA
jgi:tetratricopeptide (TPR) repeat protein